MYEAALDAAVDNYSDVNEKKKELENEKKAWDEEQEEIRKEKEAAGEPFEPEVRNWPNYSYQPFKNQKEQFVICLNTMGQDRQFTADEKNFALTTVRHFKKTWEAVEKKNLERDIAQKIEANDYDKLYKEYFEQQDLTEIDKCVDEAITMAQNAKTAEGEDELTEAEKDLITKQAKF